ncbi:phospholipase B1, membrane-associated-like [Salvelinus alpinus]
MGWLLIAVATCALASSAKGNKWWWQYEEGIRHYSQEALHKEFPEKTRPVNFTHSPFQCPDMSRSPTVPSSVELVKAADIKVIAALGDSLTESVINGYNHMTRLVVDCLMNCYMDCLALSIQTAIGANATNVLGIPIEFRHVSWSIGGHGSYQDVITLANIVRLFNPNVLGAAPAKTVHGTSAPLSETGFNLAVTGHNTFNLPGQTRHLIDTLRNYKGLNFDEDWKLLTILIGMNDICDYCKDKVCVIIICRLCNFMCIS